MKGGRCEVKLDTRGERLWIGFLTWWVVGGWQRAQNGGSGARLDGWFFGWSKLPHPLVPGRDLVRGRRPSGERDSTGLRSLKPEEQPEFKHGLDIQGNPASRVSFCQPKHPLLTTLRCIPTPRSKRERGMLHTYGGEPARRNAIIFVHNHAKTLLGIMKPAAPGGTADG